MNYKKHIEEAVARHCAAYDVPPVRILVPKRALDPNYPMRVEPVFKFYVGDTEHSFPVVAAAVPDVTLMPGIGRQFKF